MHEVLFENSIITLRTLNILLALGFLFAGIFCIRYTEKHKLNITFLTRYFLPLLFSGLVVGRLFYGLENFTLIKANPILLAYFWDLNFSFFGISTGLVGMLYWLTRKTEEDFWAWIDVAALSTVAVLIFSHLGFFFSGIDYGLPTTLPWGIPFDTPHIPYITPLHPIQLYASVFCVLLLAYSVGRSKRIHLSGVVGTRAIMLYSLCMLGIDFLRGEPTLYWYNKIAYASLAAICFIASVNASHKTHIK